MGDFDQDGWLDLVLTEADVEATVWVFINQAPDFNSDQILNAMDIDLLNTAIASGVYDSFYDVNNDGYLDSHDRDALVLDLLRTFYGDANLDDIVDLIDLSALAANFDMAGGWADGDFNGDGLVDLVDLSLLATNFGSGGL